MDNPEKLATRGKQEEGQKHIALLNLISYKKLMIKLKSEFIVHIYICSLIL